MRALIWMEVATLAFVSALLASPALAQSSQAEPPPVSELPAIPPIPVPPPAPPPPAGYVTTGLVWVEQPGAQDFARWYPQRALDANVGGRVTIDCLVGAEGRLSCTVVSEEPLDYGFGDATLAISREFRLAPQTTNGTPTAGGRMRRTIRWVLY
jgi:periplasmic protein TonB